MASAVDSSIGRLTAMTAPNALTGSPSSAFWYATTSWSLLASPTGLPCLTMAQVGPAKSLTIR